MATKFDLIDSIITNNEHKALRFKIRIIRIWRMPNIKDRDHINLINMVFIDEKVFLDNQSEIDELYPREIDSLKERKFLFKVRVKRISSTIWSNTVCAVQDYVLTTH
ncbi:hypothetical protein MTR_2g048240 [Medicago truncatula]|uniref:Uncharacterized protein n=1 Tax=Medicago truncatula TaxID=3880 RepID=G7ISW8_MEDTR|nr:hypothetical protein MTR_2g048240 [Medicago truncatula]